MPSRRDDERRDTCAPPGVLQMPLARSLISVGNSSGVLDAEQDRGLHIDRDDQPDADVQHDRRSDAALKRA